MSRRVLIAGCLAAVWIVVSGDLAWGCPNCGEALANAGKARGFAASLAVMLGLPAVLVSGWAWVFWQQSRRDPAFDVSSSPYEVCDIPAEVTSQP